MPLAGPVKKYRVLLHYDQPFAFDTDIYADSPEQAEEIAKALFNEKTKGYSNLRTKSITEAA